MKQDKKNLIEIWGGLECTVNRVGDDYFDQCEKNGHHKRLSDFEIFSELGIKKIRYPCLWEWVSPASPRIRDWSVLDPKLNEIEKQNLNVIAGLLHHGSGPSYTNLLDPQFPEIFADYARDFSQRYPWISEFTPINEIMTTARFSCLYGHWYPHIKSDYQFLKAMFNQCRATVLAMTEIRKIVPHARLIQTEDIGKCQSTEVLNYQRDFENERRWLTYDILCGKLNKNHALYSYLLYCGITEDEMQWFVDHPCPPDVLGINHYLLSNRFLDHRLELYPAEFHGGNGRHNYADVGALDTGQAVLPSPQEILRECWERFGISIAVTEVHTRGHREEQMRWFYQMWKSAQTLKAEGIDILAITAWSLLGTYDWHKLCTTNDMFYEPGVFDLRAKTLRPKKTALVKLINELSHEGETTCPLIETSGTWTLPRRILFAPAPGMHSPLEHNGKQILIIGASGTLGRTFAKICALRNLPYRLLSRQEIELSDFECVHKVIEQMRPWAIINAAGYVKVDEAEREKDLCFRDNVIGPINLARTCALFDIPLLTFSSDLVFNGEQSGPYHEEDSVDPLNTYGFSKAVCEEKVSSIYPNALVVRSSAFFGPWDQYNFVTQTINRIRQNEEIMVAHDCRITPTYLPDLAHACLDLLIDGESGIFHLTNRGEISWANLAHLVAERVNLNPDSKARILEKSIDDIVVAKRPKNSCLISVRGYELPTLENAIDRYFTQITN